MSVTTWVPPTVGQRNQQRDSDPEMAAIQRQMIESGRYVNPYEPQAGYAYAAPQARNPYQVSSHYVPAGSPTHARLERGMQEQQNQMAWDQRDDDMFDERLALNQQWKDFYRRQAEQSRQRQATNPRSYHQDFTGASQTKYQNPYARPTNNVPDYSWQDYTGGRRYS